MRFGKSLEWLEEYKQVHYYLFSNIIRTLNNTYFTTLPFFTSAWKWIDFNGLDYKQYDVRTKCLDQEGRVVK